MPDGTTEVVCDPVVTSRCAYSSRQRTTYDDFGNVVRLEDSSSSMPGVVRVTETTYLNQATESEELAVKPYLLGLPITSTVTQGTESVSTQQFYTSAQQPDATGFLRKRIAGGVTTEFAPDALGNVAVAALAPGTLSVQQTAFTYDWGTVKSIQTAAHTTQRVINPDGTVASETEGHGSAHPRTTAYQYDALGRLTQETPPGGALAIDTTYDTAGQRWVRTERGTSRAETTLDGFGRPILERSGTTGAFLTQVATSYYADGRVHVASLPAPAGATSNPGTIFGYDDASGLTMSQSADGVRTGTIGVVEVGNGLRVGGCPDSC